MAGATTTIKMMIAGLLKKTFWINQLLLSVPIAFSFPRMIQEFFLDIVLLLAPASPYIFVLHL